MLIVYLCIAILLPYVVSAKPTGAPAETAAPTLPPTTFPPYHGPARPVHTPPTISPRLKFLKPPAFVRRFKVHHPNEENILAGKVVLINGYNLGTTMLAIATMSSRGLPKFPDLDLRAADFYTNAYRWALRALSLIPEWLAGGGSLIYPDSQKVWTKRFFYMDDEIPQWLRSILFYVSDWEKDRNVTQRYNLLSKPAFEKHYRFPSPYRLENFASFRVTKETVENIDDSNVETVSPRLMAWGPAVDNHNVFTPGLG